MGACKIASFEKNINDAFETGKNNMRCKVSRIAASIVLFNTAIIAIGDRPNIVFIFTDDHAPQAIGAYGSWLKSVNPTPNIDRLAAAGMLFQNSFCTNSICGPSRAVILTGKHSHINGFRQNEDRFDPAQQTFPKLLQHAGYETAVIGKWHLGSKPRGFDHWQILDRQGSYYDPIFLSRDGAKRIDGYCTDIVTDLTLTWLREREHDKPFFLMCQHKAPHRNWMPATRHAQLYADQELPEPRSLFDELEDNASPARHQEMEINRHMNQVYDLFLPPPAGWDPEGNKPFDRSGWENLQRLSDNQRAAWHAAFARENMEFAAGDYSGRELVRQKYQRYLKNYLRCITAVDESVGRILEFLESSGLAKNTIVIYSSDQGFFLGEHGWFDKRWMYEESLKMPLIVKWPGVTEPGSVNTHLVQNLDYASTFLDIAGLPMPADLQGKSLVPLLRGARPDDWRDAIYYHYYEYPSVHMVAAHNGVRTQRYKLIHFYQFDEWELYDLQNDPDELVNQYDNPIYAEHVTALKRKFKELRDQYRDDSDTSAKSESWQRAVRQRQASK